MRITKKFTGASRIGKKIYKSCDNTSDASFKICSAEKELEVLEARFRSRVRLDESKCIPKRPNQHSLMVAAGYLADGKSDPNHPGAGHHSIHDPHMGSEHMDGYFQLQHEGEHQQRDMSVFGGVGSANYGHFVGSGRSPVELQADLESEALGLDDEHQLPRSAAMPFGHDTSGMTHGVQTFPVHGQSEGKSIQGMVGIQGGQYDEGTGVGEGVGGFHSIDPEYRRKIIEAERQGLDDLSSLDFSAFSDGASYGGGRDQRSQFQSYPATSQPFPGDQHRFSSQSFAAVYQEDQAPPSHDFGLEDMQDIPCRSLSSTVLASDDQSALAPPGTVGGGAGAGPVATPAFEDLQENILNGSQLGHGDWMAARSLPSRLPEDPDEMLNSYMSYLVACSGHYDQNSVVGSLSGDRPSTTVLPQPHPPQNPEEQTAAEKADADMESARNRASWT